MKSKIQKKQLERIVKANEVKRPTFHFQDTNGLEDEIVMYEKMKTTRFANKLSDFMSNNNISRVQLAEMTGKKWIPVSHKSILFFFFQKQTPTTLLGS